MKPASTFLLLCMLVFPGSLYSQGNTGMYLMDNNGGPVNTKNYTDVVGSPFLNPDWSDATLKLKNGELVQNASVKINQHSNEIHFLTDTKQEIILLNGLVEELTLLHEGQKIRFIVKTQGAGNQRIFQVLKEGKCLLLGYGQRKITEVKEFNSATITRKFQLVENDYLMRNNDLFLVTKDSEAVIGFLGDKEAQVRGFIQEKKLKIKKTADLIQVIDFYNSL